MVLDVFAATHPLENLLPLIAPIRREQDGNRVTLDFLRAD